MTAEAEEFLNDFRATVGIAIIEVSKKNERIAELEAKCGAMRVALKLVDSDPCKDCMCRDVECECDCSDRLVYEFAHAALAGDAGRALLERVEKLEWAALKAKQLRNAVFEKNLNSVISADVYALGLALDALETKP